MATNLPSVQLEVFYAASSLAYDPTRLWRCRCAASASPPATALVLPGMMTTQPSCVPPRPRPPFAASPFLSLSPHDPPGQPEQHPPETHARTHSGLTVVAVSYWLLQVDVAAAPPVGGRGPVKGGRAREGEGGKGEGSSERQPFTTTMAGAAVHTAQGPSAQILGT